MIPTRFTIALLSSVLAPFAALAAPAPWNGTYTYEQSLGRDVPGVALFVTHRLTLAPGKCLLKSQGYQTDDLIHCTTAAVPGGLAIKFASWEDGRLVNKHDVRVYGAGQTLFTLKRQQTTLLTSKVGFFTEDSTPEMAVRFRKAR